MDLDRTNIWSQVLAYIKQKIPHDSYLTWFGPLKYLGAKDGAIEIGVPNRFFYEFLETHYGKIIIEALDDVTRGSMTLTYRIMDEAEPEAPQPLKPEPKTFTKAKADYDERTHINPRYSFENFVEGGGNSFAKAAALAVAEDPGHTPFNPLFIYGLTGLGKTHLLQAVGNFSLVTKKTKKVIFVTSEKFMNDFIFAIKAYKTTDFSRFYRSVDMLLLDDVQFFQGKERTQLEFFHTFNSLYQAGKQIVLTSDRPPKELDDFDKRLISRIGWGLVTDIQPPEFETRLAILQRRADRENIYLPEDVAEFLASIIKDNIRDLEAALISLLAHSSISGKDITIELAKEVLRDLIQEPSQNITIEFIQQRVADYYKIPVDLIIARNRKKEIVRARQVAMYLCTELTKSSLQSIGLHFGNRDHSTVIHAREVVSDSLKNGGELCAEVDELRVLIC
jgi:chromosomal replication initiator protein